MATKGDWIAYKAIRDYWLIKCGLTNIASTSESILSSEEKEANAHLICSAVNACAKVNPDNPQAGAESIPALYKACRSIANTWRVGEDFPLYHGDVAEAKEEVLQALAKADRR